VNIFIKVGGASFAECGAALILTYFGATMGIILYTIMTNTTLLIKKKYSYNFWLLISLLSVLIVALFLIISHTVGYTPIAKNNRVPFVILMVIYFVASFGVAAR
jgi:hypothetical protein